MLPDDLIHFLLWLDHDLWSWIVNPERRMFSDGRVMTTSGEMITHDHPANQIIDPIGFYELQEVAVIAPSSEQDESYLIRYALSDIDAGRFYDKEMRDTRFLQFGHTDDLDTQGPLYCLDHPSLAGSIAFVVTDNPGILFRSSSLTEWLESLIELGGFEPLVYPGNVKQMPRKIRAGFVERFRELNPGSRWFQ